MRLGQGTVYSIQFLIIMYRATLIRATSYYSANEIIIGRTNHGDEFYEPQYYTNLVEGSRTNRVCDPL